MFEAYSVGIRLSLINGVSGGLIRLSRDFKTAEMSAMGLRKQIQGIGAKMLIGGALTGAGLGVFGLMAKTIPAATAYANQLALMNTLGERQVDVAKAVGAAWAASYAVPTSSVADNLTTIRELHSVLGGGTERLREAGRVLPAIDRIQGILTAVTGREQDHVGFDVLKAIELRSKGAVSETQINSNMELMSRTLLAMQGTVTAADYHGALKMSKGMSIGWSDDFTYKILPTLIQELKTAGGGGGQSAGTYLATLSRAVHGHVQKSAIPYWEMAGLINKSDVVRNSTGQWQLRAGATKGIDLFDQNSYAWFEQVAKPGIQNVMKKAHLSAESAINAMFTDRNAAFMARTYWNKEQQFTRDQKLIEGTQGLSAYNQLLKTSPQLAALALQKQWQNTLAVLGYSIMPDLLKATQALLPVLQGFTKWANAHPHGVRTAMRLGAVGGAALTGAGTIVLAKGVWDAFALLGKATGWASKLVGIPALGPIVEGVGTVVGALTLPEWGVIAAAAGVIIGAGVGIYKAVKDWDPKLSIGENIRKEWGDFVDWAGGLLVDKRTHKQTGPVKALEIGVLGINGPEVVQAWVHIGHQFIIGFRQATAPLGTLWQGFAGQIKGIAGDIQGIFTSLQAWIINKLAAIAKLLHLPPPAGAPGAPKPTAKKPALRPGGWTLMGPKDYGHFFGEAFRNPLKVPLAGLTVAAAALHVSTANARTATDGIVGQHRRVATADADLVAALRGAAVAIAQQYGVSPHVPPPSKPQPIVVHQTTNLDGRPIHRSVTTHLVHGLSSSNAGNARHDPSATRGAIAGHEVQ